MTEDKVYTCPVCGLRQVEYSDPQVAAQHWTVQLWAGGTCSQDCARLFYLVEMAYSVVSYLKAAA